MTRLASIPRHRSTNADKTRPSAAAQRSAVALYLSSEMVSAPYPMSWSAVTCWPLAAHSCSGVSRYRLVARWSAPRETRSLIASLCPLCLQRVCAHGYHVCKLVSCRQTCVSAYTCLECECVRARCSVSCSLARSLSLARSSCSPASSDMERSSAVRARIAPLHSCA